MQKSIIYRNDNGSNAGITVQNVGPQIVGDTATFLAKWGSNGNGDGQFSNPYGVAVDSSGNIYVADNSNYRIQKFDSSSTFVIKRGSNGSGDGQFNDPNGVTVDGSGNVYVADSGNHRIRKFSTIGPIDATSVTMSEDGSPTPFDLDPHR